jgi:hypothetical protein
VTRVALALKHLTDEGLSVELELNRGKRVATLHMQEYESDLVVAFVTNDLPRYYGVHVIGLHLERSPEPGPARWHLVIALAGRHHPVRLAHQGDGHVAIRLLDPDAAYLAKTQGKQP